MTKPAPLALLAAPLLASRESPRHSLRRRPARVASVSSWADEIRRSRAETGPWHYIDIPITAPHLNMARAPEARSRLALR